VRRSPAWLLVVPLLGACGGPAARDTLVVAHPAAPVSLKPNSANEELTLSVLSNVYEGLVDFDAKLAAVPALAESWHTEDDLTWVFRLRDGVRFHDGSPLEAADAARSIEWARTAPESRRHPELAEVASVTVQDPRTLVIRTREPFGALPHRLASIAITRPADGAGGAHVGTGPYRVVEATPEHTVLEAFAGYARGAAAIRHVEFRVVPEAERRLELLRRGEVDFVIDVPAESVEELRREPGLRLVTEKGLRVLYLGLDTVRADDPDVSVPNPFRDVRVRRAIAMAIDREALVRGPLKGQAELVDQIVAPPVFGYDAALPPRVHDVAVARRLMAEAGHGAGFGVTLDYMPAKYRAMGPVVAALARDLRVLNVDVRLRPSEPGAFLERLEGRRTAMWIIGWMSTGGDALITYNYLLHSPVAGRGVDNGGYSSPALDALLSQAKTLMRPEERQPLLSKAARLVADDVPVVPLYRQTDLYAVSRDLQFEPRVDRRTRAWFMRWER
jgi:peptide/nickel transport system substrate-binding protein